MTNRTLILFSSQIKILCVLLSLAGLSLAHGLAIECFADCKLLWGTRKSWLFSIYASAPPPFSCFLSCTVRNSCSTHLGSLPGPLKASLGFCFMRAGGGASIPSMWCSPLAVFWISWFLTSQNPWRSR